MLLRNESKLLYSVSIDLIFDDDTELHRVLHEGDVFQITYRHNSNKITNVGKLVQIKPVIKKELINKSQQCNCHFNSNPTAILVMDFSIEKVANLQEIAITDIIKIADRPSINTNRVGYNMGIKMVD